MAFYKGTALANDLKELIVKTPMLEVNYVADIILPEISVKETAGKIPVLSTSAGMKTLDLKRGKRGTFKRGEWTWGNDSYTTFEYGYEEPIDNVEALDNADIFNEEIIAGNIAKSQLFLAREKRVADAVYNTTTFAAVSDSLTITNEWDDATNADAFGDITDAQAKSFAKCGKPRISMHLLCNEAIFRNIMRSTKVRADVKYTRDIISQPLQAQQQYFASFLGIAAVHIATSFVDTSSLGVEAATFETLWSDEYAMYFYPAQANLNSWKVPGLGRQPVWGKFSKDYRLERYGEDQSDSLIIRAREYRGEHIDVTYGVLMDNMTT